MKTLQLFGKQFSPSNWPFNLGNRNFTFSLAFFRTWLHISLWKWALAFIDEQRAQLSVTGKILANSFWNDYRVQKWWKPAYVQETQKVTARKWLCIWIFHFLTLKHQNKIIKNNFISQFFWCAPGSDQVILLVHCPFSSLLFCQSSSARRSKKFFNTGLKHPCKSQAPPSRNLCS